MANVKVLLARKEALKGSLEKFEESNAKDLAKIEAKEVALNEKAVKAQALLDGLETAKTELATAKEELVSTATGRKERIIEGIAELDAQIQEEVGALQAQLDAIRGVTPTEPAQDFGTEEV